MAYGRFGRKSNDEEDAYGLFKPEGEHPYGLFQPEEDNAYGDSNFYKSVKPNLTGSKPKKAEKSDKASKGLGDAEKGAVANPIAKTGDGAKNILNAETGNGHKANVNGRRPNLKNVGGLKGIARKGGPIAAIILMLISVGLFFAGGQLSMPFALVANMIQKFNAPFSTSTSIRSRYFLRWQTNGQVKDCIKSTIFSGDKFKLSSKQKTKLSGQGIETTEVEINGKKVTVMVFDDNSTGGRTLVVPDDAKLEGAEGIKKVKLASGEEVDIGRARTFDFMYNNVRDFFKGYNKGSLTWKGTVGAWFDRVTLRFLDRIDASRNHFKRWRERVEERLEEVEGNTRSGEAGEIESDPETAKKTAEMEVTKSDMQKGASGEVSTKPGADLLKTDEDSEDGTKKTDIDTGSDDSEIKVEAGKETVETVETKTKELGKSSALKASKAASVAKVVATSACTITGFIGTAGALAVAAETVQIIRLITSFTEAFQKVQAGEGDDSPIHILSEALVSPGSTSTFILDDENNIVAAAKAGQEVDIDSTANLTKITVEGKENTTAMQASGISNLFGGGPIDQNDPSVQSFNILGSVNKIVAAIGLTSAAFITCTAARIGAALVDIGLDIVGCFTTGCLDSIVKKVFVTVTIAVSVAVAAKLLMPKLASILTRDLIADLAGEDLGNALASGANIYMSKNFRSGGGSLTDEETYLTSLVEQQKVIADNARYERETRSPFDASSQYTFLGSLLNKFATFYTSNSSVSGAITTIGNITKNSLASILPSASAVSATTEFEEKGECPYLESIGAVGDGYCNPYVITDTTSKTISMHPADVVNYIADENLDDEDANGTPRIKKDSNLAKYVLYCSHRDSAFGIADQNIANTLGDFASVNSGSSVVNAAGDAAIGMVPVFGGVVDILQNKQKAENLGWITGESCVAGNTSGGTQIGGGEEVTLSKTPSWKNEGEYFQRFLEDQRLMESIDPDYVSAETAFLDEYYTEHPLDNSYEGVLARYSGLPKETVVATLDAIEYMNYIADYDPTTRYDFAEDNGYQQRIYIDSNNNVAIDSENIITEHAIVYYDIRNRTATV